MKTKNKNLILYMTVALSVIVFSTLIFVAYGKYEEQIHSKNTEEYTIILDAGHGGEDGGAVGVDGITEKDINLSIALKLRDMLAVSGYDVIMTREEDKAIYDPDAVRLREKKRSDLKNRLEIIKANTKNENIFISIHQNKFTNPKYFGTQIFYSRNNAKSETLANSIKDSIVGLIQPDNTRELKPAEKNIYLLHHATLPAVIVECGFLSNPEEAKKLNSDDYQGQIAFCIYCGIATYFANL